MFPGEELPPLGYRAIIIGEGELSVRTWLVIALFAVVLAGCGGTGASGSEGTATDQRSVAANERVERCTERFLERVEGSDAVKDEARRYVEVTYCAPFAERGWVYEDGTLSIAAHSWLIEGSSEECASAGDDEPVQTAPCDQLEPTDGTQVIDCAILQQVRRSEVRDYVEQLKRIHEVECDDGTPLAQLGAPG
jgi:hypothetical protein